MDFFEQQSRARSGSWTLLALFVLVCTVLFFAIAFSVSIITNIIAMNRDYFSLTATGLFVAGAFWVAIALGCLFRWLDVRSGGAQLARRFGAQLVDEVSRDENEQQLLAVINEMSIAASVPAPSAWILPSEHTINAFVLGGKDDVAVVVTRAAIEDLQREQLQAVIGHEIGHVVQGDLTINMRLLIVLSGLMALNEVGDTIGENFVGSIFRILGGICVFSGTVIRAAFSRRREYLADAMAVQFTRNPSAVASALDATREHHDTCNLKSCYRHELAHLCFNVPQGKNWLAQKLATHPPISKRIAKIDPHFAVKQRGEIRRGVNQQTNTRGSDSGDTGGATTAARNAAGLGAVATVTTLSAISAMSAVGATRANSPSGASASTHSATNPVIGDRLALMMSDANSCLVGVFTLFASSNEKARRSYFNSLAFSYQKPFADKVERLYESLGNELKSNPLPIICHVGSTLQREVKRENRRRLMKNLEMLVAIEEEVTLINYACLTLLRRKLEVGHETLKQVVTEGDSLSKLGKHKPDSTHTGVLLSLLIEASGNSNERNLAEYRRVMSTYSENATPFRSSSEKGIVPAMQEAFDWMYVQPIMMRDAFLEHCRDVIVNDFEVTHREELLLNLFAAALDAHVPVLSPSNLDNNLRTGTLG